MFHLHLQIGKTFSLYVTLLDQNYILWSESFIYLSSRAYLQEHCHESQFIQQPA